MIKKEIDKRGILISFEGGEGSGKSTQIKRLKAQLKVAGKTVFCVHEPGSTAVGESIRTLIQHTAFATPLYPETELLLFAAARAQMMREVIAPALNQGQIVLCDRFLDSSTVYQGTARSLDKTRIRTINRFAVGDRLPDLTVILDVPVEIGRERMRQRKAISPDRMEQEPIAFHQKVREGYLQLAHSPYEKRFLLIDATESSDAIARKIGDAFKRRFYS